MKYWSFQMNICQVQVRASSMTRSARSLSSAAPGARPPEQVPLHGAVSRQPALVHLFGGPAHDAGIHAVLHGQHPDHAAAQRVDEPLHQAQAQAFGGCPEGDEAWEHAWVTLPTH